MVVLDCHLANNGDPKISVPKQQLYEVLHQKNKNPLSQMMRLFPLVPQEIPKHMGGNTKGKYRDNMSQHAHYLLHNIPRFHQGQAVTGASRIKLRLYPPKTRNLFPSFKLNHQSCSHPIKRKFQHEKCFSAEDHDKCFSGQVEFLRNVAVIQFEEF